MSLSSFGNSRVTLTLNIDLLTASQFYFILFLLTMHAYGRLFSD